MEITCMIEIHLSKTMKIMMMDSETTTYLEMIGTPMWMKKATSTKTIIITQFSNSRREVLTTLMMSHHLGLRTRRKKAPMIMI